MRHILVNHALARKRLKRGGDRQRTPLSLVAEELSKRTIDLLAEGGRFGFTVPMALLGDDQAAELRAAMLDGVTSASTR